MAEYDYSKLKSSGTDVFINKNVEIKNPQLAELGNHVAIDYGFYCTTPLKIGNYVHIGPHVTIVGGKKTSIKVGSFCTIAAGCRLICASEKLMGQGLAGYGFPKEYADEIDYKPIIIEDFVSIATNSIIFPGSRIREGCVIGAGSIVKGETEPWTVYLGVPARPIKARPKKKMLEFARKLGFPYKK